MKLSEYYDEIKKVIDLKQQLEELRKQLEKLTNPVSLEKIDDSILMKILKKIRKLFKIDEKNIVKVHEKINRIEKELKENPISDLYYSEYGVFIINEKYVKKDYGFVVNDIEIKGICDLDEMNKNTKRTEIDEEKNINVNGVNRKIRIKNKKENIFVLENKISNDLYVSDKESSIIITNLINHKKIKGKPAIFYKDENENYLKNFLDSLNREVEDVLKNTRESNSNIKKQILGCIFDEGKEILTEEELYYFIYIYKKSFKDIEIPEILRKFNILKDGEKYIFSKKRVSENYEKNNLKNKYEEYISNKMEEARGEDATKILSQEVDSLVEFKNQWVLEKIARENIIMKNVIIGRESSDINGYRISSKIKLGDLIKLQRST